MQQLTYRKSRPKGERRLVGKPKGMLQALRECGFIDPEKNENDYTVSDKKDKYGNIRQNTSLQILIESLLDFVQEETLLQWHGRLLGVEVERTPKCHPELAGEGIEYC